MTPTAIGYTNMNKAKQHIVLNGSSLSDSQSVGLGSPTHRIIGSTPTNEYASFPMNNQDIRTSNQYAQYIKMDSNGSNAVWNGNYGSPSKNCQGHAYFGNGQNIEGLSRKNGRSNTLNYGNGPHSPLTPQDKNTNKSSELVGEIQEYRTPQLNGRSNTYNLGTMAQREGHPNSYLSNSKNKSLSRQNSDPILEEESIFFFKTNL